MPRIVSPDKKEMKRRATELADRLYERLPNHPELVARLETIFEIYWYMGHNSAE